MSKNTVSPAEKPRKKRRAKARPLGPEERRRMVDYIRRTGLQRSFQWPDDGPGEDPLIRREP
jgi:hypothetical protein